MKAVVLKKEAYFIGKIDDIIAYLNQLQTEYKTVKEYIDAKQGSL